MTKLIIGLGNPGKQYERTRHNVGFIATDFLVKKLKSKWREDKKLGATIARNGELMIAKPQKIMNNSGTVVARISKHFNLAPKDLLVIYDDADIPLGELRLRGQGGSAGHRGMQSIIDSLHTQSIQRLRIGIGRPADATHSALQAGRPIVKVMDTSDFVLHPFTAKEMMVIKTTLPEIINMLR